MHTYTMQQLCPTLSDQFQTNVNTWKKIVVVVPHRYGSAPLMVNWHQFHEKLNNDEHKTSIITIYTYSVYIYTCIT